MKAYTSTTLLLSTLAHPLLLHIPEPLSNNVIVQMIVSIILMDHWAQFSIPIIYSRSCSVVEPPFFKLFCSQRSKVVDDSLTLFPNHQPFDRFGVCKFVAVVNIVVKA